MITIKTPEQIILMKEACKVVGDVLRYLEDKVVSGITTEELDKLAYDFIISQGATPSFLGYCGFPKTLCVSVNEEVIHGIPSKFKVIKEGDIVSVDVGAIKNGYHGDAARTFICGESSEEAKKLVKVTKESFFKGIENISSGSALYTIGAQVQSYVESFGYSVVRDYVGHGIGTKMHEDPSVPNYGIRGTGIRLKAGMTLAIEPMVNAGNYGVKVLGNGWTVVTKDNSLSAHYENTVLITESGVEVLTL